MCGIVGSLNLTKTHPIQEEHIRQMLAMIRYRGPDEFGIYLDNHIGMGNARLSVIDLSGGQQPISNEDGTLWIVFNGEIYNYIELKYDLELRGHRFSSNTDTEVLIHLYEEYGPDCLQELNGQFAIALWDSKLKTLLLARDRLGIRPLYYTIVDGSLIFGSEIKAILAYPRVSAKIDLVALDQIFTFWAPLSPRTIFQDIWELPAGHYLRAQADSTSIYQYWRLQFPQNQDNYVEENSLSHVESTTSRWTESLDTFRTLLTNACQIRLRADVPVGVYLSGGLDSSTIAAIINKFTNNRLYSFSISFSDPNYDESKYQSRMASFLGTDHQRINVAPADIGSVFPDVIWHTETPIMRTSPAPLFLLSKLVLDHKHKVILTGEGADEFLAGYNIFKEAGIRRFWARKPGSKIRPLLLQKLYPYIRDLSTGNSAYLTAFFGDGLTNTNDPYYSHAIRWRNTSRTKRFFSEEILQTFQASAVTATDHINLPEEFNNWTSLSQAQYLEITIFMSQYLLSSQGDRMSMAHSIEGRLPFLDHRVVEFCNQLPPTHKLNGLTEKYLLKQLARELLPDEIWQRSKRPYRAPIQSSFFGDFHHDYVHEILSNEWIRATGLFNGNALDKLVTKCKRNKQLSETDGMALSGILSTQLIHYQFFKNFHLSPSLNDTDKVKIINHSYQYSEEISV